MARHTTPSTRPPWTSLATVVGVTALLVVGLLSAVSGDQTAAVGVLTGVLLALSLWLSGWERRRAVGTTLASVLALPVAVGLAVAAAGTVVSLGAELFPVASRADARPAVVTLLSQVAVVFGCLLATFGASAAVRGVIDADRVATYGGVVARTTLLPTVVALALFARGTADYLQSAADAPGTQRVAGEALRRLLEPVFDPVPGRTHLAVFSLALALAGAALAQGVSSLPVAELVPETSDTPDVARAVNAAERVLWLTAAVALLAAFVAGVAELSLGQAALARALPTALYDAAVAVTGASGLRRLLWWLFLAGSAVSLFVWFLRRAVQSSADRVGTALGPYVGGAVLVAVVLAVAEPAVRRVETALRATPAAGAVDQFLAPILGVYGPGTLALLVTVAMLLSTLTAVGQLWTLFAVNYLGGSAAGVTLAAAGLFSASAFAATLAAPTWLVLAGLVGAVVVWDAGAFGTALGREVGTGAETRRTELVHTGGTVAVGGIGAAAALGLTSVAQEGIAVEPPVAVAALLVCLLAVVTLVAAIR